MRCDRTDIQVRARTFALAAVVLHADDLQRWAALRREASALHNRFINKGEINQSFLTRGRAGKQPCYRSLSVMGRDP